jgi:[ribosomal protein S18]-alanine N-acetyltransferase
MSARPSSWTPALRWRTARLADVDAMLALEQRAYSHPWTHGNFVDSVVGGHWIWLGHEASELRAYWLAMPVLDELHLLNLAVDPARWGQGLGRQALLHLREQARQQQIREVWLEVRVSNVRAQRLYQRDGFLTVGRRREYYPGGPQGKGREDAYLMSRAVGQSA